MTLVYQDSGEGIVLVFVFYLRSEQPCANAPRALLAPSSERRYAEQPLHNNDSSVLPANDRRVYF